MAHSHFKPDPKFPNQDITWEYEEETTPQPVLVDIEAGNRTNLLINVLHLPHETIVKWEKAITPIILDASKSMLGLETSTGFDIGQQHIMDFLQKSCSQQHILTLATNHLFALAQSMSHEAMRQKFGEMLVDYISIKTHDGSTR